MVSQGNSHATSACKRVLKILFIVGARPQFIKLAAMQQAVGDHNKNDHHTYFEPVVIHTGQHYDVGLSKIFFDELGIRDPDYQLNSGSGTHGEQTARMLIGLEASIAKVRPDIVAIFGDTNTTLAGALAAKKMKMPLVHIEAGLRNFDLSVPEEVNRKVADHISDVLFCPTPSTLENCKSEGLLPRALFTGDVMYDCFLRYRDTPPCKEISGLLRMTNSDYYVTTLHRSEATDSRSVLYEVMRALAELEKTVLFPLHPRTRNALQVFGISFPKNVIPMNPVSYLQMAVLLKNCAGVLTDSSGLQKEAYFFQKPCIVLRKHREWIETLDSGWAVISGTTAEGILTAVKKAETGSRSAYTPSLFGDGSAGRAILRHMAEFIFAAS